MNIFKISISYLAAKPLNTFLNVVLFTFGIFIIVILILFSRQLEDQLARNTEGVDLVAGAKGSPLQIILCNIFHVDFPTGNISLKEAEKLAKNPQVKKAIPLALGDSYRAYRIVGSTVDYLTLYGAALAEGKLWEGSLEVVAGANVARTLGIRVGDQFASQHGLSEAGALHEHDQFTVVGILRSTNTVLDNLILTAVQSVWEVHEEHGEEEHGHEHEEEVDGEASRLIPGLYLEGEEDREITSLLMQFRSPMGAVMLPRMINDNTNMQAASPAFETARLFSIVGVGVEVVQGFAVVIIFIAALSIFIALYSALKERSYDLAIMRSLGATRARLFFSIILEGMLITLVGSLLGFLLGHLAVVLLGTYLPSGAQTSLAGWKFLNEEWWVLLGGLTIGFVAALIPAIQIFRTDISKVLAKG